MSPDPILAALAGCNPNEPLKPTDRYAKIAVAGNRGSGKSTELNRAQAANQAIEKRVQPEHLAGLIAFLASDDAELITGQMLLCDGGGYLH